MIDDVAVPFEKVYTMTDYYDGPRRGIADFGGCPHLYESEWNDINADDEEMIYRLSPVDTETLELALEDWSIWLRWDRARHNGEVTSETHPALPADRARHAELQIVLKNRLKTTDKPVRARGNFRRARHLPWEGRGHPPPLEVHWLSLQGA